MILVIAVIAILAITHKSQPLAQDDAATLPTATQTSAISTPSVEVATSTPKGEVVTTMAPQLHFVSQTAIATADASTTKHGLFMIQFTINSADKPLYVSQVCNPALGTNGVSFSLVKDGIATTDGIGNGSCLINSVSGASLNAANRFVIPAYTPATLRMTVVTHPSVNGTYKVRINQVGYATSDKNGNHVLDMDAPTRDQMQTNTISL